MNNFLMDDIWETVSPFIPADKKKEIANRIVDIFEDENLEVDYEDLDSQILKDAGLVPSEGELEEEDI